MTVIQDLDNREVSHEFLTTLLDAYVERQGLGAMPKADLDALILHLYVTHTGMQEADPYTLAKKFKIKESRVKTLLETAWVKFVDRPDSEVWTDIIQALSMVVIERESLEKAEVRFKLQNPGHMLYIRKEVRDLHGTATYSSAAERVVIPLETFNRLLDSVFINIFQQGEAVVPHIRAVYVRIRDLLGEEAPNLLEEQQTSKLGKVLEKGSQLAGIGNLILSSFSG